MKNRLKTWWHLWCIFDRPQVAKTCENYVNSSQILLRSGRLWTHFLSILGAQSHPKWNRKPSPKSITKSLQKSWENDGQMDAKTEPKGNPGRPKPPTICGQNPDVDQGIPRDPKGSKRTPLDPTKTPRDPHVPKWIPNGPKWTKHGPQMNQKSVDP